jgi:hypothetical protein
MDSGVDQQTGSVVSRVVRPRRTGGVCSPSASHGVARPIRRPSRARQGQMSHLTSAGADISRTLANSGRPYTAKSRVLGPSLIPVVERSMRKGPENGSHYGEPVNDSVIQKDTEMKRTLALVLLMAMTLPLAAAGAGPAVYVDATTTVDASNSGNKASQVDFGSAIVAALHKKDVPVIVVTDPARARYTIKTASSQKEDSTGTKIAKLAFGLGGGFTKFEGTIQVIDNESSAIVYAYNVKKGNFQSAAEAFAKHFKNDFLSK